MKKNNSRMIPLCAYILCISCIPFFNIYSQNILKTWEEQLHYLKDNPDKEQLGDIGHLHLINYTYMGVIESETDKIKIMDSLFSYNAPTILHLPPLIVNDTIITDNSYEIRVMEFPMFEITTMGILINIYESREEGELVIKHAQEELGKIIEVGFEFLELKWSYKKKLFSSICIVSNKHGGIIYDGISTQILTSTMITKTETRQRKWWKLGCFMSQVPCCRLGYSNWRTNT